MRSTERITRKPHEYADHKRVERQRICDTLLRDLAKAREERADWYVWVTEVWAKR
jgi:hypothetical protein